MRIHAALTAPDLLAHAVNETQAPVRLINAILVKVYLVSLQKLISLRHEGSNVMVHLALDAKAQGVSSYWALMPHFQMKPDMHSPE